MGFLIGFICACSFIGTFYHVLCMMPLTQETIYSTFNSSERVSGSTVTGFATASYFQCALLYMVSNVYVMLQFTVFIQLYSYTKVGLLIYIQRNQPLLHEWCLCQPIYLVHVICGIECKSLCYVSRICFYFNYSTVFISFMAIFLFYSSTHQFFMPF